MKNKKNIYILLPAVLIIWGIVGYRLFSAVKPNRIEQTSVSTTTFKPQQLQGTGTFTINSNYRDPFLGTLSKNSSSRPSKKNKAPQKKAISPFPSIIYKGLVSPNGKNHQIFLINVNGQQFFFKKHSTYQEVKLIGGTRKHVVLKFKGQQQTFPIAK